MELLRDRALVRRSWPSLDRDAWGDALRRVCGSFNPGPLPAGRSVTGSVRSTEACGTKFAQVVNDLDEVTRDWSDIRSDQNEHLFLIFQLEGACGVDHEGRRSRLETGECILVDSTRPTRFSFEGRLSNHLSLHLPRQSMYADGRVRFEIARKLASGDPMNVMLRAIVAKIMASGEQSLASAGLRDLLFSATRQAFVSTEAAASEACSLNESAGKRLHMVEMLIDRHLTDSELSVKWLATRLNVSIRTLQQDFQGVGMTCTSVIRDRRLRYAREKIERLADGRSRQTIADVAFSAGFNDVSYFNRSFRELFACAPTDLIRGPATRREAWEDALSSNPARARLQD